MNNKHYYHINWEKLEPGFVIPPGSMGNFINQYVLIPDNPNNSNLTWRLFQEQTFELIRSIEFPQLPSRMKSIFLFETLNEAICFIKKDKREGEYIYKVKILNEESIIHKASMKLYERIPMNRPVLPALIDQARQYWRGINLIDEEFQAEIVVESSIEIIDFITY